VHRLDGISVAVAGRVIWSLLHRLHAHTGFFTDGKEIGTKYEFYGILIADIGFVWELDKSSIFFDPELRLRLDPGTHKKNIANQVFIHQLSHDAKATEIRKVDRAQVQRRRPNGARALLHQATTTTSAARRRRRGGAARRP
jgi:hypothetical protein